MHSWKIIQKVLIFLHVLHSKIEQSWMGIRVWRKFCFSTNELWSIACSWSSHQNPLYRMSIHHISQCLELLFSRTFWCGWRLYPKSPDGMWIATTNGLREKMSGERRRERSDTAKSHYTLSHKLLPNIPNKMQCSVRCAPSTHHSHCAAIFHANSIRMCIQCPRPVSNFSRTVWIFVQCKHTYNVVVAFMRAYVQMYEAINYLKWKCSR